MTRASFGLVIGLAGLAILAEPAVGDGPMRLDETQLDRITAGTIAVEADALAFAAGDRFAVTNTDTVVKTLVGPFVEVAVVVAHADAAACCDGGAGAQTFADTTGHVSVVHDFAITRANPHLQQATSLTVAVGISPARPAVGAPLVGHELWSATDRAAADTAARPEARSRNHYGPRPTSGRAKAM